MRKFLHKISMLISALLLSVLLVCSAGPLKAAAGYEIPGVCQVQADGGTMYTVKTLDYDYAHNTYFSLRDIAMVLKGTDKAFSLEITKNAVTLIPGGVYTSVGVENALWAEDENPDISLRRNEFKVNEQKVFYYTLILQLSSGDYDCYMMAADLAMILDADVTVTDSLQIHTQSPFAVSPDILEETGYFDGVNGVLVGDATTGEIYYRYRSDLSYPIASTSKLMTCLLVLEAVSAGQITLEEQVTISEAAAELSASGDGVLPLTAGEQISVQELLVGALLPSSNECALCLAEAVAGSEEAFVQMMNRKAQELGLSQAVFYNSNGLPSYTEDFIPAKRQNSMSAEDMFRLVSYLLKVFPQVKDITSLEKADIHSLGMEVNNTNPLLRNLSGVTGLKTGTTNKAGACLVTSLSANDGIMEHDLVVIVLGTEDSVERGRVSGLLARYALNVFDAGPEDTEAQSEGRDSLELPLHAEAAVDRILQTARKY